MNAEGVMEMPLDEAVDRAGVRWRLARKLHAGLGVIEPDPVVEREAQKWSPARGFRESEQILQERRRFLLVLGGDSQVVELNGHIAFRAPPHGRAVPDRTRCAGD